MPEDLQSEITRVRAEIERLTKYLAALERARGLAGGLTSGRTIRTVSTVQVENRAALSSNTKRGASRSTRRSPALKLLYEADMTVAALALELNESRSLVSKWFGGVDEDNRAIPRATAERLEKAYKIPLSAWARIAD